MDDWYLNVQGIRSRDRRVESMLRPVLLMLTSIYVSYLDNEPQEYLHQRIRKRR